MRDNFRASRDIVQHIVNHDQGYERLISGKIESIRSIAKALDVHERIVGRILRCAFLAPDIVEKILEGRQPPQLSLEKLRLGVPLVWAEQCQAFSLTRS